MFKERDETIQHMLANSYRDFHVKGFDYVCLKRTPALTIKAYFFDGHLSSIPEVVCPHDHRYKFRTEVVDGRVANHLYAPMPLARGGTLYERFDYMTPLNGGNGFTWVGTVPLAKTASSRYNRGQSYNMRADDIHTIQILRTGTILLLYQYADSVPLDMPTKCFAYGKEPPSLEGLYSRFTADQLIARLKQVDRAGYFIPK